MDNKIIHNELMKTLETLLTFCNLKILSKHNFLGKYLKKIGKTKIKWDKKCQCSEVKTNEGKVLSVKWKLIKRIRKKKGNKMLPGKKEVKSKCLL